MKLSKLKSIANNALQISGGSDGVYREEPFSHIRPKQEITVDLITGDLKPPMDGDSVDEYFKNVSKWFSEVIKKEKIPMEVIEKAIIRVTPEFKQCIIHAEGREYKSQKILF
jgi:hypothetical protein